MSARAAEPQRVVSLVPSETFNVACLGGRSRLVGRTRYCVEPPEIASVSVVGGTKDLDVELIHDLNPDLVLANQEENSRSDIESLQNLGLEVLLAFPRTFAEGMNHFELVARRLGLTESQSAKSWLNRAKIARDDLQKRPSPSRRCFVPIWSNPWMTINRDTYIDNILWILGLQNIFGDYPSRDKNTDRDTRYPVVDLDEVVRRQPDLVLLPDEPYRFGAEHVAIFNSLDIPAARTGSVICASGRDLCWHGAWAIDGVRRLEQRLGKLSPSGVVTS